MPSTDPKRTFIIRKPAAARYDEPPLVVGRSLIEGDGRIEFPAFYRVEKKPVTFRSDDAYRSREEREEYVCLWFERLRRRRSFVMLLIPHHIYAGEGHAIFHAGYTLSERDGEIRTHQSVVLLAGDAVPVGRADQGVLCVARVDSLSAWDGRTEEQSRAQAA